MHDRIAYNITAYTGYVRISQYPFNTYHLKQAEEIIKTEIGDFFFSCRSKDNVGLYFSWKKQSVPHYKNMKNISLSLKYQSN